MDNQLELIICIINSGFSELVMEIAKECGARGGTVLNARGTAREGVIADLQIHPEKEMVMIIVSVDIKDEIIHQLYLKAGINTPGQGIVFTLPIDEAVGISL